MFKLQVFKAFRVGNIRDFWRYVYASTDPSYSSADPSSSSTDPSSSSIYWELYRNDDNNVLYNREK